ncbi:MAG: hypothetical protein C4575_10785 [Desulforudis sp.]|jgi:hypothetical protein|nr:MAG: hypothetical protein C4575_10785 [Desulforudis sp.]
MRLLDFIFSYPKIRTESGHPDFEREYLKNLQDFAIKYKHYGHILKLFDYLSPSAQRAKRINILFVGGRFLELIKEVRQFFNPIAVATGKRDRLDFIKNRTPYVSGSKWVSDLFEAYKEPKSHLQEQKLQQIISNIKATLEYLKPCAVVLPNDSLFLERAILYGAKKCNIPTVTIQHGLFMAASKASIVDGHYTDYMLVWGEFFKKMFISRNIAPASRIYVLGYPFNIENNIQHKTYPRNRLKACFLGQPFEKYNCNHLHVKVSVLQNVLQACKELNIPLFYRTHPGEERSSLKLIEDNVYFTPKNESLTRAFDKYDVFFSISSTALVEAALRGKICAQIFVESLLLDKFEEIGACYTLSNSYKQIKDFLRDVCEGKKLPFGVSSKYIYCPDNLAETFFNIMQTIRVNWENTATRQFKEEI